MCAKLPPEGPLDSLETLLMTTRMRSPWFHCSPRDCCERGRIASRFPRSTMMLPRSNRFTKPLTRSPILIDVLLVNVTANRVADFLKQDLFRSLRSDAAQFFHRQRNRRASPNSTSSPASSRASSIESSVAGSVDFVDDNLRSRKFDAGFRIPIDLDVLARA